MPIEVVPSCKGMNHAQPDSSTEGKKTSSPSSPIPEGAISEILTGQSLEPRGSLSLRANPISTDVLPVAPNSDIFKRCIEMSIFEVIR